MSSASQSIVTPGQFVAILVLDRAQTDAHCQRAFWIRVWLVAAGGLVLICLALAWMATVWLLEARGRARVLEADARHWRDLSQAAAGLAHETRNPLGLIRGWTQRLAQSELPSEEQRHQVRAVVEECDRVTSRINQFLAFARPCQPTLQSVDPDRGTLVVGCGPGGQAEPVEVLAHSVRQGAFVLVAAVTGRNGNGQD